MLNFCNYAITFLINLFILVNNLEHVFSTMCIEVKEKNIWSSMNPPTAMICSYVHIKKENILTFALIKEEFFVKPYP